MEALVYILVCFAWGFSVGSAAAGLGISPALALFAAVGGVVLINNLFPRSNV